MLIEELDFIGVLVLIVILEEGFGIVGFAVTDFWVAVDIMLLDIMLPEEDIMLDIDLEARRSAILAMRSLRFAL